MCRLARVPWELVLSRRHRIGIGGYGLVFAGVVLSALFWAVRRGLGLDGEAGVLEVQPPSAEAWGVIALMSFVPLAVGQVMLGVRRRFKVIDEKRTEW